MAGGVGMALRRAPPTGVFFARPSPSSHIRGHRFSMEGTGALVDYLEASGRRVVNGSTAIGYENSKVKQELALQAWGIPSPATQAASSTSELRALLRARRDAHEAARGAAGAEEAEEAPFLLKHNRGGSGAGVRVFAGTADALAYVDGPDYDEPITDGITLIQEYVASTEQCLYRLEFVGSKFLYAVRVDTSSVEVGQAINNCPADSCQLENKGSGGKSAPSETDSSESKSESAASSSSSSSSASSSSSFSLSSSSASSPSSSSSSDPFRTVRTAEELEAATAEAAAAGRPSVTIFSASWCKSCKTVAPGFAEIARARGAEAAFIKVDCSGSSDVGVSQGVTKLPTIQVRGAAGAAGSFVRGTFEGAAVGKVVAEGLEGVLGPAPATDMDVEAGGEAPAVHSADSWLGTSDGETKEEEAATGTAPATIGNCPLTTSTEKFRIVPDFTHPVIEQLEGLLEAIGAEVCGMEVIIDKHGDAYCIDMNCTNSNYNLKSEAAGGFAGRGGPDSVAALLKAELERETEAAEEAAAEAAAVAAASVAGTVGTAGAPAFCAPLRLQLQRQRRQRRRFVRAKPTQAASPSSAGSDSSDEEHTIESAVAVALAPAPASTGSQGVKRKIIDYGDDETPSHSLKHTLGGGGAAMAQAAAAAMMAAANMAGAVAKAYLEVEHMQQQQPLRKAAKIA